MNKITFIIEPYHKEQSIRFRFGVIINDKPVLEIDTNNKAIIEKELLLWEEYRLNHYGFDLDKHKIAINNQEVLI